MILSLLGGKIPELLAVHPELGLVHVVVVVVEVQGLLVVLDLPSMQFLVPSVSGDKIRHNIRTSLKTTFKADSATRPDWSSFS